MTTYYVNNNGGSDVNDGLTEGNAWETIQHAADTVLAGDIVYIKGGTTYVENVAQPSNYAGGNSTNFNSWIGYTNTPGDNGRVVVTPASGTCWSVGYSFSMYQLYMNLSFNNGNAGFSASSTDNMTFYNCEFNGNSTIACYVDNTCTFINCSANNNGSIGIRCGSTIKAAGCEFINNFSDGFYSDGNVVVYRCLAYGNGSYQIRTDISGNQTVLGCTTDGKGTAPCALMDQTVGGLLMAVDNIYYSGTVGIDVTGSSDFELGDLIDYNLFFNNTADDDAIFTSPHIHLNSVYSDPLFIDDANNDYRVRQNSPLVGAGIAPGVLT